MPPYTNWEKNKVIINRELAALSKDVEVTVNNAPMNLSERIVSLYELGKNRVITNREIAATKLLVTDDTENAAPLSETRASASEIAGCRLYIQAQQRAERKKKLRQIMKATPLPQMKLATHQGCHKKSNNCRASSVKHFLNLYEQGKNKVTADRELDSKFSHNTGYLCNEETNASYASIRQVELYEMGKTRLNNKRINAQENDIANDCKLASQPLKKVVANATMLKLYEMSREVQESGRDHREGIAASKLSMNMNVHLESQPQKKIFPNDTMKKLYSMSELMQQNGKKRRENIVSGKEETNMKMDLAPKPSKVITPNATMIKLYAMSKPMQENGKDRRDEILLSKAGFPVVKV